MRIPCLALLGLLLQPAQAQTVTLKAARILDGRGRVIERASIVITGNSIERVGSGPAGTTCRILTSLGGLLETGLSPEEVRHWVRERAESGADLIKIFASESIRTGGGPTLSREQVSAACEEARRLGLRTAVHAHGPESARRAVEAGCTVIEHGALLDDETLRMLAERGTYYDPHKELIYRVERGAGRSRCRRSSPPLPWRRSQWAWQRWWGQSRPGCGRTSSPPTETRPGTSPPCGAWFSS